VRAPRDHDPRPTGDVIRGLLLRDRAAAFRQAAAELVERAAEMEREVARMQEAAHWQAEADRELDRAAKRRRAA